MEILVNLIRILTAAMAPLGALALAVLTAIRVSKDKGSPPDEGQGCLRCERVAGGAEGRFYFTESIGNPRERSARSQMSSKDTPVLGDEAHFICDHCAYRYIRNELFQLILMVLPYPLYLFVITPMFAESGIFADFLIETLLIVLSVSGFISALDLFRAVQSGDSPLAEARDRVAIHERKEALGKKFSYYTRKGISQLKK